jgi:hypothetical protein
MNKELKLLNFGSTKRGSQKESVEGNAQKNVAILEEAPSVSLSGERTS